MPLLLINQITIFCGILNHFAKENLSSLIVDKFSNFIEISKNYFFTLRFNTISIKF